MARQVKDPAGWLKGPYLQLGLPFTAGAAGKQFFKTFETQFAGQKALLSAALKFSELHGDSAQCLRLLFCRSASHAVESLSVSGPAQSNVVYG